jgi:PPOX class probable F420-dependent enzyme
MTNETGPSTGGRPRGETPADRASAARPRARPVPRRRLPGALFGARMAARTAPRGALEAATAPRTGSLAELARAKRTLLISYRRDGTPVPTPVWAAPAGGLLYVRTESSSGKVKRLRNDARLLLAPCTVRGEPLGPPLEARGRLLEPHEEALAEHALVQRYGTGRALFERAMDMLRVDMCFLELTPGAWEGER